MNSLFIFFSGMTVIVSVSSTNYCSWSICGIGVTHIACGHSGNFASTCPADTAMVNIDANLKATVVNAHNAKRNLVASGTVANHSPACRMATMEWDDELASIAALNVKQCAMAHDICRNTDEFKYSGQNLAWMGYFGIPNDAYILTHAIDLWYSEVADSKMEYIKAYPGGYTGPEVYIL